MKFVFLFSMANLYLKRIFILMGVISMTSCLPDLEKLQDPNWTPEMALPLIDSRFNIDRIIKRFETDGYITTDNEDVIVVVYKGNLFEFKGNEIIQIDDITIPVLQKQQTEYASIEFDYAIKSLDFKECDLEIDVLDNLKEDIRIELNMPKTTKNGNAFKTSFIAKYTGGSGIDFSTTSNLDGYLMDLSGDGTRRNRLEIYYSAQKVSDGSKVDLDLMTATFKNISFDFIDGYFGNIDFGQLSDSIAVNMFDNFKSGTIILEDPKFEFSIENGFGIPLYGNFGNMGGSGAGGSSTLSGSGIDSGIVIGAPSNSNTPPSKTNKVIDSSNSNITQFLSISPKSINFDFNLQSNLNKDTNTYNFVSSESELKGNIELYLPFKGVLDSVILEDVYEFKKQELKNVEYATFKLFTENAFPIGIYMQIYFLDVNGNVIDSLIEDNTAIFKEAITDANGFSIQAVSEESYFTIGQTRFSAIRDHVTDLKLRVMLNTLEAKKKSIKMTKDNYFDVKLGVRAELSF